MERAHASPETDERAPRIDRCLRANRRLKGSTDPPADDDEPGRETPKAAHWGGLRTERALSGGAGYLIASYTLNIGMYMATTMKPTMPPTSTIMTGSRIDVRALIAAATSSS